MRTVISRCLARDPAARPQLAELLDVFAPNAAHESTGAGFATRAAALLGPGWLPSRVVAALCHQSAAVLATEIPRPTVPTSRQD